MYKKKNSKKKYQLYFFFITALDLAVVFRKIDLHSLDFSVLFSMQSKSDFPDSINTKSRPGSLPEKHASKYCLLRYKSDTIPRKKCELHCRIHHLMSDQLSNCLPSSHSRKKSINLLANIAAGLGSIILIFFFFCNILYDLSFKLLETIHSNLNPYNQILNCHYKIVMYNFI